MSKITALRKIQEADMTTTAISKRELRDEMWRVSTSLRAVSDLMMPEPDLSNVNRERLATLLEYLSEKLSDLMTQTEP